MALLDKVARERGRGGRKSYVQPPFWANSLLNGGLLATYPTTPDKEPIEVDYVSYIQQAYKGDGIVFALILARQLVFSEARFLWREDNEGRLGRLFRTDELSLLENPWPGGTTGELLGRMEVVSSLAGSYYATTADDRGRIGNASRGGPGRRIVEMRPDWVTLVLGSKSGSPYALDTKVVGLLYDPKPRYAPSSLGPSDDAVLLLPGECVFYSPLPDPDARFRGMSWLTPLIREIQADKAATIHKAKFFEHGATPNLVIKFDRETESDAFNEFVERYKAEHQGAWNAYKSLFLTGGADVEVVGADFRQLDFSRTQGKGESRIASAAGVPPSWVGFSEGLQGSALNAGNFHAARRRFADGPQPLNAPVLTPTGWVPMGEISPGAQVIGPDGQAYSVTEITEQPDPQDVYRVDFIDGTSVECTQSHRWTVKGPRHKWHTMTLGEILARGIRRRDRGAPLWAVPLPDPIQYEKGEDLPLDPYALGLLLGDGCFVGDGGAWLSSGWADVDETQERLASLLPEGVSIVRGHGNGCAVLRFKGRLARTRCFRGHEFSTRRGGQCRECYKEYGRRRWGTSDGSGGYGDGHLEKPRTHAIMTGILDTLGLLGVSTKDKFIPREYLMAEVKDRVSLLQGLIDSDGCVTREGDIRFTNSSRQLVADVMELVRSLGGIATLRTVRRSSEELTVGVSRLPEWIVPARLSRKVARLRQRTWSRTKSISGAELVRRAPTRCLSVDSPGNLYVAAGFTLTHNTMRPLWRMAAASLQSIVGPSPDRNSRLWYDDRDIPFLRVDAKDEADIARTQASALRSLLDTGWNPDAAVETVLTGDFDHLKGQHTGLFSVQLRPPTTMDNKPDVIRVQISRTGSSNDDEDEDQDGPDNEEQE